MGSPRTHTSITASLPEGSEGTRVIRNSGVLPGMDLRKPSTLLEKQGTCLLLAPFP